jgi:hypothetical protein
VVYSNYFNDLALKIVDRGFTVTPTKGKTPIVRIWNNPKPTDRSWLASMLKAGRYAGRNLGIVCGRVVGIDLDADNPAKAAQLKALAEKHLGSTPFQRVGRSPRTLLLYRPAAGEIIASMRIFDCIDVLSGGRQFIAFGIHPDTGKPYEWIADSPETMRLDDVPEITAAAVKAFADAVSKALRGSQAPIVPRTMGANLKSRQSGRQSDMFAYDAMIKRDANGRVVDGREAFMAKLLAAEYAEGEYATPDDLGLRVWARFSGEADLSRPKGSNPKQRWKLKDARSKARAICCRKPDLKAPRRSRGKHPASYLNSFRKPGFWTRAERERFMAETERRIITPVVLVVSRVMLEAVDMATGFCTLSIADIAKQVSCSTKSVTKSRAALSKSGLWIAGPRGVFVPVALNSGQVVERKGRKAVEETITVPSLYHLVAVSAPCPSLPAPSVAMTSWSYQADMLGAPVVDFDAERYRRGILPGQVSALVRAEMRARGVTQDELGAELGISQPQVANALAGRFGLSPEPASRLLAWLRKAA